MIEFETRTTQYFTYLLEHAEKLLAAGEFDEVSYQVLVCSNNMRSGWTEEVSNLYHHPKNPYEQKLSNQMANIIERTLEELVKAAELAGPSKTFMGFGQLEHIAVQLHRLGERASQSMIGTIRRLLEESRALGAPEQMMLTVPALELLDELDNPPQEPLR